MKAQSMWRFIRSYLYIALVCGITLAGLSTQSLAQNNARYFPETGHYLQGVFDTFWQTNGGVEIFGFPITEEYVSQATGRTTQYFERARFELVLRNGQPSVELGKIGLEFTTGRDFATVEPVPNTTAWRYFPETQHIIQLGFKDIWETKGSEAIFGYPISEEISEPLGDDTTRTVQYFERARFEYWPEMPAGERVIFSRLGTEMAPPELQSPLPPGTAPGTLPPGYQQSETPANTMPTSLPVSTPTANPTSAVPATMPTSAPMTSDPITPTHTTIYPISAPSDVTIPSAVNAMVSPQMGAPGEQFAFQAYGFKPNEPVGIWLTAPDQTTIDSGMDARADDEGSIAYQNIIVKTKSHFADGIWSINAQGIESSNQAVAFFRISRANALGLGNPAMLGVVIHDEFPVSDTQFVVPVAAPASSSFTFVADGYTPGEEVSGWVTNATGESMEIEPSSVQIDANGMLQMKFANEALAEGTYVVVAHGHDSDVVHSAPFKVTRIYIAGAGTQRPANTNGQAQPSQGGIGTLFSIRGSGLMPNEPVEFWMTDPAGAYTLYPTVMQSDSSGRVGYAPALDMPATQQLLPGVYGFHFRGTLSQQRVDIYFTYTGSQ